MTKEQIIARACQPRVGDRFEIGVQKCAVIAVDERVVVMDSVWRWKLSLGIYSEMASENITNGATFTPVEGWPVEEAPAVGRGNVPALQGAIEAHVKFLRRLADDSEAGNVDVVDRGHRRFVEGRVCALREEALNLEDIVNDNAIEPPEPGSGRAKADMTFCGGTYRAEPAKLHEHPGMQRVLAVPDGHVVIDREAYEAALEPAPPVDGPKSKCAMEIRFDESGNVLKAERYIFNRAPREGDPFIEDWKEYRTVKAVVTFGQVGGAMLEHVVRLVADRTPSGCTPPPAPPVGVLLDPLHCSRNPAHPD